MAVGEQVNQRGGVLYAFITIFKWFSVKKKSLKSPKSGGELDKKRKLANKYMEIHAVRIQAHSNFLD